MKIPVSGFCKIFSISSENSLFKEGNFFNQTLKFFSKLSRWNNIITHLKGLVLFEVLFFLVCVNVLLLQHFLNPPKV